MKIAFPSRRRIEAGGIDQHFAAFASRFGGNDRLVRFAAAALSRSVREGHICIPLETIAASFASLNPTEPPIEWRDELRESMAVGLPEFDTPLVLDRSDRLYLRRYWNYQSRLAAAIREKCSRNPRAKLLASATQEDAVEAALRNELTIICGGPGTGKTATVIRILKRLLIPAGGDRLRIALCAPTGKAASRLEEAVREAVAHLPEGDPLRGRMPQGASTIHRLLGRRPGLTPFWHNAENPLPADVVMVDEASMVSLALLSKLFDALPARCRVLLLGDQDQLGSVEPGSALADIVEAAEAPASFLRGSVLTLRKNYRFGDDSAIQRACSAVRRGDAGGLIALLREGRHADLVSTEISTRADLEGPFAMAVAAGFREMIGERDPAAALAKLRGFRVLTPLRHGPWGVTGLNDAILKTLDLAQTSPRGAEMVYSGRPILISQNDYELELYNGDLGLLLADPSEDSSADRQLYAWFFGKENSVRRIAIARLPEHETAFAMTVHKSQGSEFDRTLFILPESDHPLLTRELIYTALTRARSAVQFCWNESVLRAAVGRQAQRESGLCDLLVGEIQEMLW
jgi:exodeoxyribonuclease V alpha subunit